MSSRQLASGATLLWDIVGVYSSEGLPDLIRVTTVTFDFLVGENSQGRDGRAGGIGNVAIAHGFNRFNHDVTVLATSSLSWIIYNSVLRSLTKKLS